MILGRTFKAIDRLVEVAAPTALNADQAKRILFSLEDEADTSPFLRLPEDWFRAPAGFRTHPHRGMQTVTIVLDGELEHRDHTGAQCVLGRGDIQWMTAGSGILHSELARGSSTVHCLQLWLNLPAARKMSRPRHQTQRLAETPVRRSEGAAITVYAGTSGEVTMPHGSDWPLSLFDIRLDKDALFSETVSLAERTFLYVLEGTALLNRACRIAAGHVVWFVPEGGATVAGIELHASGTFRALLFSSPVIREPVVAHGPFVMNSVAEIQSAYADLENGTFAFEETTA